MSDLPDRILPGRQTLPQSLRARVVVGWVAALTVMTVGHTGAPTSAAEAVFADSPVGVLQVEDALNQDVSPPLRHLMSLPIPSSPIGAVQLKGLLEKNDLWAGFSGPCGDGAQGELTVLFDPRAGRFMVGKIVEDLRCVAVSVSEDATGPYDRYAFVVTAVLACDATCQAGFVTEHNRVRTRVNNHLMPGPGATFQPIPTPPLAVVSWDATIAGGSQAWADGCSHTHSGAAGLGENIYYSAGSVPTPAVAVASWESESTNYTYAAIGDPVNNFNDIGHYTQLVWANTGLIGCGVTHCTANTPFPGFPEWDFVVCRYSPPGNATGQFPYVAGIVCSTNANCNDNNVCSDDVCNNPGTPGSSCSHTNNTAACNDGNACTSADACATPPNCGTTQNFDGVAAPALPSGWTATGTGSLWVTVNSSSDTVPNSAFADDPAAVTDKWLDSPPIPIASATATVSFKNRFSLESTFDGGVLEIKIGAGAFTDIVTAGGSFVTGGYTGLISAQFGSPIGGRNAWTGASSGYPAYLTTTVALPAAAAGQTIQLRWRVASDTTVSDTGQNIDSIVISDVCPAVCTGGPATNCNDSNACTNDSCNPVSGCGHTNNTAVCDDGNACTAGDVCGGGACGGTPVPAPPETQNVTVAADKATYNWSTAASATRYDVVRGSTASFPVGPGDGDEVCFDNLAGTTLVDPALPAPGAGFWYLSRGESACGIGTFGTRSNGTPRTTTTCP